MGTFLDNLTILVRDNSAFVLFVLVSLLLLVIILRKSSGTPTKAKQRKVVTSLKPYELKVLSVIDSLERIRVFSTFITFLTKKFSILFPSLYIKSRLFAGYVILLGIISSLVSFVYFVLFSSVLWYLIIVYQMSIIAVFFLVIYVVSEATANTILKKMPILYAEIVKKLSVTGDVITTLEADYSDLDVRLQSDLASLLNALRAHTPQEKDKLIKRLLDKYGHDHYWVFLVAILEATYTDGVKDNILTILHDELDTMSLYIESRSDARSGVIGFIIALILFPGAVFPMRSYLVDMLGEGSTKVFVESTQASVLTMGIFLTSIFSIAYLLSLVNSIK